MNKLGLYLLVCLGFVVAALFEFALVIFISRRSKPIHGLENLKKGKIGDQGSILADQRCTKKMYPISERFKGEALKGNIRDYLQGRRQSERGMFKCMENMAPIHVIDVISSWVFIMAFALFNYVYWSNIVNT